MTLCAAVDCKNTGTHIFPKGANRRKQWIKALRRRNWEPSRYSRLCSDHFKPDDYYARNSYTGDENLHKVLKKCAVPSIFSFSKVKSLNPIAQQRSDRLLERNTKKLCFENASDHPIAGPSGIQTRNKCESQLSDEQLPVQIEVEIDMPIPQVVLPETVLASISTASKTTQVNFDYIYGSIERYKDKDSVISFYTGFETYAKFYFVYSTLSPMAHSIKYYGSDVRSISTENQFFMTLIKLRQNKCNFELAQFFEISSTTVCNIFITWINYMDQLWTKLNLWPEKELLSYMPDSFKRAIIDETEIGIQKPEDSLSQRASLSSDDNDMLVDTTPGLLSYCSPAYDGSIRNQQTVEMCEPGEGIPADSYNIQDTFSGKDITLNVPKLLNDRKFVQHVPIEHIIGLMKTYKIIKEELHHNLVPLASKIFFVCLMCCNFRECIK